MEKKATEKNMGKKIGFGILFVAACFVAAYILVEFHRDVLMIAVAAVLLLLSSFLFMSVVFLDKVTEQTPEEENRKAEEPVLSAAGDGEFRLKIAKHMKEMESGQKELVSVLKNQNLLLQTQLQNLERGMNMLLEKQENQAKSIIKFNKENARQLAISERETLEYMLIELKKAMEKKGGSAAAVLEDVAEEELFNVSELPGDDEYIMPELTDIPEVEDIPELTDIPEVEDIPEPTDIPVVEDIPELTDIPVVEDIPELTDIPVVEDIPELTDIPVPEDIPVVEDIPAPVEEPAPDPLAGMSSDPNAMMTPEDIAKLLEAMGQ